MRLAVCGVPDDAGSAISTSHLTMQLKSLSFPHGGTEGPPPPPHPPQPPRCRTEQTCFGAIPLGILLLTIVYRYPSLFSETPTYSRQAGSAQLFRVSLDCDVSSPSEDSGFDSASSYEFPVQLHTWHLAVRNLAYGRMFII